MKTVFLVLVFFAVGCIPLAAFGQSPRDMVQEVLEDGSKFLVDDYQIKTRALTGNYLRLDVANDYSGIKIVVYSCEDVTTLARLFRFTRFPIPTQVYFSGDIIENGERVDAARLGYCFASGVFHANNVGTEAILAEDSVLNLYGWWPAPMQQQANLSQALMIGNPVPGGDDEEVPTTDPCAAVIVDCDGQNTIKYIFKEKLPGANPSCFGAWEADKDGIETELCKYFYHSTKALGEGKCYCLTSNACPDPNKPNMTDLEKWRCARKKCSAAWRKFTSGVGGICPAPAGKDNGHTPDTCAGGAADPQGCFIPMDSACNQSMGGQCGKGELPYLKKWNNIVFEFWELKYGPGPDGTLGTGDDVVINDTEGKPCFQKVKDLICSDVITAAKKTAWDAEKKMIEDEWERKACEAKEADTANYKNYITCRGKELQLVKAPAE